MHHRIRRQIGRVRMSARIRLGGIDSQTQPHTVPITGIVVWLCQHFPTTAKIVYVASALHSFHSSCHHILPSFHPTTISWLSHTTLSTESLGALDFGLGGARCGLRSTLPAIEDSESSSSPCDPWRPLELVLGYAVLRRDGWLEEGTRLRLV